MRGANLLSDPALPGLAEALEPEAMTPRLSRLAPLLHGEGSTVPKPWRVVEVDILKHTPGRRCALGYTLECPGAKRRLFGKIFSGERGPVILETLERIAAAIPRQVLLIPRPIGHLPDLRLLVTEYLDGTPLAPSLYQETSEAPARRIAAALAALHGCEARLTRRWSARQEWVNTDESLARASLGAAPSSGPARGLLRMLSRRAARLPSVSDGPIHRDFYAEQVWACGEQSALLDLDDARLGDPALDIGNFLAHLKLRSLQFAETARGCERARPVFLEEYEQRRAGAANMETFRQRVSFYEATSLLRLAGVYSRRDRWADRLPGMLVRSCEILLAADG
jgi:hypothetical protein